MLELTVDRPVRLAGGSFLFTVMMVHLIYGFVLTSGLSGMGRAYDPDGVGL
jgi:hypothetical protein